MKRPFTYNETHINNLCDCSFDICKHCLRGLVPQLKINVATFQFKYFVWLSINQVC